MKAFYAGIEANGTWCWTEQQQQQIIQKVKNIRTHTNWTYLFMYIYLCYTFWKMLHNRPDEVEVISAYLKSNPKTFHQLSHMHNIFSIVR